MKFDTTEKKVLKKNLLRLRETKSFKTKPPPKKCRNNGLKRPKNQKRSQKLSTKFIMDNVQRRPVQNTPII